jgi:hypothetical protein
MTKADGFLTDVLMLVWILLVLIIVMLLTK